MNSVKNVFLETDDGELQDIYLDYINSKKEGLVATSISEHARKIKSDNLLNKISIRELINLVENMFFEEVARRYFLSFKNDNYKQYYSKGNDCDICIYQCIYNGDVTTCKRFQKGLDCDFIERGEEGEKI